MIRIIVKFYENGNVQSIELQVDAIDFASIASLLRVPISAIKSVKRIG